MTKKRIVENMFPAPATSSSRKVFRAAVLVTGVAAITGCESVPDYANPVEWYRGVSGWFDDEEPAPTQTAETPGANQDFPSLGTVPDRPELTVEERRRALREGLAADTSGGVQYSGDPLRSQTQPPPQPQPATSSSGIQPLFGGAGSQAVPAAMQPLPAQSELSPPPPTTIDQTAPAPSQALTPQAQPLPAQTAAAPADLGSVFGDAQPLFDGSSAPQATAPMAPRDLPAQATIAPRAEDLTARASVPSAPALATAGTIPGGAIAPSGSDPYLAYYSRNNPALVPQGLASPQAPTPTFQQPTAQQPTAQQPTAQQPTAQQLAAQQLAAAPPRPFAPAPAYAPTAVVPAPAARPRPGFGQPIMNLRSPAPSAVGASVPQAGAQPFLASAAPVSGYSSGQPVKAATIYFDNGSAGLTRDDRGVLRQLAQIQKTQGGAIQIVAHASNRTKQLPAAQHEIVNFRISVARAESVRRALVGYGVKAASISIAAEGDSQPTYSESMPSGEAGNRRADVFMVY